MTDIFKHRDEGDLESKGDENLWRIQDVGNSQFAARTFVYCWHKGSKYNYHIKCATTVSRIIGKRMRGRKKCYRKKGDIHSEAVGENSDRSLRNQHFFL